MRKYTWKSVVILLVVIGIGCVIMYGGLMSRDYRLTFEDGVHFAPKMAVPAGPALSINNGIPGKFTVTVSRSSTADGFQVDCSRFSNMFIAKSYNTNMLSNTKEIARLSEGATYYVRARYYRLNDAGRKVYGSWGPINSATVRQTPKRST